MNHHFLRSTRTNRELSSDYLCCFCQEQDQHRKELLSDMLSCEEFLSEEFPKDHLAIVPARSKYTCGTSFYASKGIEPDKNRRINSIIGSLNNDASL